MEISISDITATETQSSSIYEEKIPSSYDALADIARGVARLDNLDVVSPYQEVRRKKDTEATCNSYTVRTQSESNQSCLVMIQVKHAHKIHTAFDWRFWMGVLFGSPDLPV